MIILHHCFCFAAQLIRGINTHQRRTRNSRGKFDSEQHFARPERNIIPPCKFILETTRLRIVFEKDAARAGETAVNNFPSGNHKFEIANRLVIKVSALRVISD